MTKLNVFQWEQLLDTTGLSHEELFEAMKNPETAIDVEGMFKHSAPLPSVVEPTVTEDKSVTYYGVGVRYSKVGSGALQFVEFRKGSIPRWASKSEDEGYIGEAKLKKYFLRFLYPHLKPSQRIVLDFIVDRSIGWGKSSEKIKKRHFIKGIFNVTDGTGLSLPTVNKAIRELSSKSMINVYDQDTIPRYQINLDGINHYLISSQLGIIKKA